MKKQISIGNFFGHNPDPRSVVEHPDIVGTALVGVEVELENIPPEYLGWDMKYWSVKNDGSLRNNGAEFVFRQPLAGADIINALDELESFIKDNKINPDLSDRTSVHVHVDVRDFTADEFKTFILMYATFEKPLFNYGGADRYDNIFCVPFGASKDEVNNVSIIVSSDIEKNPDAFRIGVNDSHKYSGCNIAAVQRFGSTEFRIHKGAWKKDELLPWVNILLCIREAASNPELSEEVTNRGIHVYTSQSGPMEFAQSVFGEENLTRMMYEDIEHDIIDGARLAQDILFSSKLRKKRKHSDSVTSMKPSELFSKLREKHVLGPEDEEYSTEDIAAAYSVSVDAVLRAQVGGWEPDLDHVALRMASLDQ